MNADLSKKIIDDLEKVGFPAEVAISTFLNKEGWIVYNGALFEDANEDKSREIDIHAVHVDVSLAKEIETKVKLGDENKLISHFVIEVKKSKKPWVFFNNGGVSWPMIPPHNFKLKREDFSYLMLQDLKEYGLKEHRYEKEQLHKSYHVAFTSPSQPSVIYEALIKTSKALRYFKGRYGVGGYVLHLFIPIIVLDGNLWSARLDKNGKVKLKKTDSLLVVTNELMWDEDLKRKFEEEQICEVITRKAFEKRYKVIRKNNKEIYQAWTNYRKLEK